MIYGFFGDIGSGKTLSMTKYAYLHYKAGYNIYSNYKLSFSYTPVDKAFLEDVVKSNKEFEGKTVFCLDEFDMYVDSRRSMSSGNLLISYFIKQIRKKNIKLFYATQYESAVDKRLRILTRTEVLNDSSDFYVYIKDVVEPLVLKIIYNEIMVNKKLVSKKKFVGNKYFDMYDTKELITLDEE